MLVFMLAVGGATLWLSVITGPGLARSQLTHCWNDAVALAQLLHAHQVAVESPLRPIGMSKSIRSYTS